VHELVIIETGHIDARFKHEVWSICHVVQMQHLLWWPGAQVESLKSNVRTSMP